MSLRSVTSRLRSLTVPPAFSISPAIAWRRSVPRAPSTTRAPFAANWRAVPSPIPLDAPVMRTTLLFNPDMDASESLGRMNPA